MDFRAKQQIIENISSEVNDLHPLLQSVLYKLENISTGEYTHGPQEKGADFVLTRFDPALQSYSHIGVVAKRGKITNDISEISRQIEECGLPRLIEGGKKKVRLSEIWVVNNSTISANAKDKIYDTYAKQRIEFIDGERLTQLVDKHAEFFWHQVPSAIGAYLKNVASKLSSLERESGAVGNISCDEFYVEPDIQEIEKITYVHKRRPTRPRMVSLADEVMRSNVSVLEGEMGFGKSKTARRLCQSFCSSNRYNEMRVIPAYYSFRLYHEKGYSLDSFIAEKLGDVLREAGTTQVKVMLVLDGIDEAAINGTWKDTLQRLICEAKADSRMHLLLTTRPLRVLGEDVDIFHGVRRFLLRPLSISKVVQFIQKACESVSVPRKIYEDLQKSDLFKQLPQSPIAAALLSSLIAQNQHDLPSNLTELYAKSMEYMLGRWDVQKGVAPEKEFQAAERVCLQIADYMVSHKLIWMSYAEARGIVETWHQKRNVGVELPDLLSRVFDKSGIFSIDDESGTISFRHRSFGEYLYARGNRAHARILDLEKAFQPYWVECTFFYIGMLGDCPELLEALFDRRADNESEAWLKVLAMPDYVLAGYQTEYSVVEGNLHKLFMEAAALYKKIRQGDTATKLTELSEMHLLWFFQRIIRHCYDYEFLRQSIETAILKIDSQTGDFDERIYALFFVACFAAQLGNSSGFEYIIKNYPTDVIPLPISLAIKLEADSKKDFSKLSLVKTHEKRLKKLLSSPEKDRGAKIRDNIVLDTKVNELFEKPLRARWQ